jgi:hypothetical protein
MIRIALASLLLAGCQYSVFARPEIVYASGKTVGVRYVSVGVQSRDNETEAMELLANLWWAGLSGDKSNCQWTTN